MLKTTPALWLKTLASGLTTGSLLLVAMNAQAAVSQSPLSLTVGVPPNLILTLDDSGSMRWAFVPDGGGDRATRRVKSSAFNPMYYNPAVTYVVPPRYSADGERYTPTTAETPTFTNALNNGFNANRGTVDLSRNYRVHWTYNPGANAPTEYGFSNTTPRLAENPSSDFSCYVSNLSNGEKKTCSIAGNKTVTIRRNNSGTNCTAQITGWVDGDCSYNSSTKRYTGSWEKKPVPAYYYTYDVTLANNCTTAKDECYRLTFVSENESQNFANWYSFYRNRALATISAASIAFSELPNSTRLTWQGLGTCTTLNSTSSCNSGNNLFREYDLTQRGRLFSWMQNMGFSSSTPLPAALKRAGEFLKTSDVPWQKFPNGTGNTAENTYACRPSYHILMTDGMWNATVADPTSFRTDHSSFVLPDGTAYNGSVKPYADTTNGTLADLAMHYWATDLRSTLSNKLKPYYEDNSTAPLAPYWNPRNNPATWQHMVNFTVGLGLTHSLKQSGVEWDADKGAFGGTGYENLVKGTKNWPATSSGSSNNAYDLWHAAINSRGDFFSADSPESVVQAFTDIMSRIAARTATAARPAINSSMVTEDEDGSSSVSTVSYQTSYSSEENWSGDLVRSVKTRAFNAVTGQFEDSVVVDWKASEKVPGASSRRIYIPSGSKSGSGLQPFTWANAGDPATAGTLAHYLNRNPEAGNVVDNKGEQRLDYLRGDRSLEGDLFRTRSSLLGDFYASTPVSVFRPRYLVYRGNALEPDHPTAYSEFAESIKNRTPRVYVGGNAGMLHGFNAQTGVEEFAFIPSAVFPNLNKLTGKNYSHHFYVDGSPVVADVFDGTRWRTILVGTLRAGGKSVFALDITTPGSEKLLWEFDDNSLPEDAAVKMGYSFSKPTIAKLNNKKWAVVFGNGYEAENHTNGKAALFVVDAIDGKLLNRLEVTGTAGKANGLSTPKLSDYNDDGRAEFAYAGDLQGNLWRFNLYQENASDFNVAYGKEPMFSAYNTVSGVKKAQPITSAPSLVRHPSGRGYLVIFGTGKYFEDTDKDGDKSMAQTVYGIWDEHTNLTSEDIAASNTAMSLDRSNLAVQSITEEVSAQDESGNSYKARNISDNGITWTEKKGWLLDLKVGSTLDGEMVVEDMTTFGRFTVFFQSLVPNNDPCGDGATSWTYGINAHTGGKLPQNVFKLTTTNDSIPSAKQENSEGGLTIAQKPDGSYEVCTGNSCSEILPDPTSVGRQTWRLIEKY